MNLEDERLKAIQSEKDKALTDSNNVYSDLLASNQNMLNQQNSWQDTYLNQQNQLADRSLAQTENKINQNKADTEKAYQKEAMASSSDYQKYINPYGVQAENMASNNLSNSGYSETTKTSAYNTSRIRTALARGNADKAIVEYNNTLEDARINNDSNKASLALQVLQSKLSNEMKAFENMTNLKTNQLNANQTIDNNYYGRYQDVISQMNYEQQQQEEAKKYAEQLAYQKEQDAIAKQQWQQTFDYNQGQDKIKNAQNWASINNSKTNNGITLTDGNGNGTPTNYSSSTAKQISTNADTILSKYKTFPAEYVGMYKTLVKNALINGQMTNDEANSILDKIGL